MRFSTMFTIGALALTSTAVPTPNNPPPPSGGTCTTSAANSCCNGFQQTTILGILSNIGLGCVPILGSAVCSSGSVACCQTNSIGLININVCQVAL